MTAVAIQHEPTGQVIQAGASLMDVISRAASDPNTDVDKLERLLGMYERITAQQAKAAYTAALAELQPKLPIIDRKGRITVTDKSDRTKIIQSTAYARWEDIHAAIRPLLSEYGFTLSFKPGVADDGKITVTGTLAHRDGHSEDSTITLPYDSSGSKNSVQAVGSSTSYGRRYVALMLLNIVTRGEDDDAEKAGVDHWITEEQVTDLVALMDEVGADRTRFLNHMRIDTLSRLPASRFAEAVKALENKRKAR
jgi:hypothetical protein